jgi:hypothetical protein
MPRIPQAGIHHVLGQANGLTLHSLCMWTVYHCRPALPAAPRGTARSHWTLMAWQIARHLLRYADVCASGYMAAMVLSNPYDGNGILKTPAAMTSNDPVCPGSRGLDGTHGKTARAAYLPSAGLAKGQKSSLESFAYVDESGYRMGHETLWFAQNVGKAPTSCRGIVSARAELERGRAPRGGLGCQAGSWSAAPADGPTLSTMAATLAERGPGLRLSQRAMDLEAHGHSDLVGVPGALSPLARVAGLAKLALERSGAGTPGHPARRTRDGALEALPVAGHKKQPEALAPISRPSTRAAFCSSPHVVGPGRLRDRRRSSSTATHLTASRRWPPSRCRPNASTRGCLWPSSRSPSPSCTWRPFCRGCCATDGAPSSSSGIKGRFTPGACDGGGPESLPPPPNRRVPGLGPRTQPCRAALERR